MKYLLTSLDNSKNTELLLENVIPARTGHIKGYGFGVTFTSKGSQWQQDPTYSTSRLLRYTDPVFITQ